MSINDAIFDLLKGTYGLSPDVIADRLAVSPAKVRKAVAEMEAEGRLWATSEGTYRCVLPPPPWLDAVRDSLDCEGWPGLSYRYIPEDSCLELYPTPFIREGNEDGGICFMIHWHVEVAGFLELFEEQPIVAFGATHRDGTSFSVEGMIGGVDAWIEILDRPPERIPPDLLMTTEGGFRQLTEEEQAEYEPAYRNADDEDNGNPPYLRGLWTPSDN
jgi:hypothetical protein